MPRRRKDSLPDARARGIAAEIDPLSPEGLRLIIADVLRGQNCKKPDASRLEKLSLMLRTSRADHADLSEYREAKAAIEQLSEAMATIEWALNRYFPAMHSIDDRLEHFHGDPANKTSQSEQLEKELLIGLNKAHALGAAMRDAKATLFDSNHGIFQEATAKIDRFNAYANGAADAFIEAVQAVNPGVVIGKASNTGPLPRFLAEIAPHVSGETVTTGAVKARLKKVK